MIYISNIYSVKILNLYIHLIWFWNFFQYHVLGNYMVKIRHWTNLLEIWMNKKRWKKTFFRDIMGLILGRKTSIWEIKKYLVICISGSTVPSSGKLWINLILNIMCKMYIMKFNFSEVVSIDDLEFTLVNKCNQKYFLSILLLKIRT